MASWSSSGFKPRSQVSRSIWSSGVGHHIRDSTFLRNHTPDIAATDLFVVPTIGSKLLCGFLIVRLDARPQRSCLDQRHNQSDGGVGRTADQRGFSLGRCSGRHDPGPQSDLWCRRHTPTACHGHPGQTYRKRGISSVLWRGKRGPRLAILPQPIGDSTISSHAIGNQESQRNLGPVEGTAP